MKHGGEGQEGYMKNESDETLRQHGGEWKDDVNTGKDRTKVKTPHVNDYPGYKSPGEEF